MNESIEIKKSNKGKFNVTKERTGKSTEELTHSKNPVTKKRAIFAQNAKKWNNKKKVNEEGESGGDASLGGTSCDGIGELTSRGDIGYDIPCGLLRRKMPTDNKKENKPENILGKTITAEQKKVKRIFITEKQYTQLMNEMGVGDAGAVGDYTANGLELKTSDGKEDPCAKAGKIKVKMVMDK